MTMQVLSLDGGGIRGAFTAQTLAILEEYLDRPLHAYFDLIVGASTGSILALALSTGQFSAFDLAKLYQDRGKEIFPKKWHRRGVFRPKYDGKGLDRVLWEEFGNLRMRDAAVPVIVPAYCVTNTQAVMFKSTKQEHKDLLMRDIARASSSAPTFFPAKKMAFGGKACSLIDGGIVMNNPALCGAAQLLSWGHTPLDIRIASFGTGEQVRPLKHKQARTWGLAQWAKPLIPVLFDGDSDAVNYIARRTFGRVDRYQTRGLTRQLRKMDAPENVSQLRALAESFRPQMHSLATRLKRGT